MALWLIRAGKYGGHEQRFFADSACYLTWEGTEDRDLHQAKDHEGIKALLHTMAPADESGDERTDCAAQVEVGLLATTAARSQPSAMVAKVRDTLRTAWSFDSRVAWLDQGSDSIAELPALDSAR